MSKSVSPGSIQPEFTAVIKESGRWWIGWIEEVPGVNCQERTREELLESLKITLREALEMNRQDARSAAGSGFLEVKIAV
jgi:predicted RNase H-like HicB family nuclease